MHNDHDGLDGNPESPASKAKILRGLWPVESVFVLPVDGSTNVLCGECTVCAIHWQVRITREPAAGLVTGDG
jgi:hypothetical protein